MLEKRLCQCELRGGEVEIAYLLQKKTGGRKFLSVPVSCRQSASCPKTFFCRFVNPLTTRMPIRERPSGGEEPAAAAS